MKTELINLIFEYEKNRSTPESEECWNSLVSFLKQNKCTESNLELDEQIKDLVTEFHKLSKSVNDAKVKLHEFETSVRHIVPRALADSEERLLDDKLQKSTAKMNNFLSSNGMKLISTLLKELEIKTAESKK